MKGKINLKTIIIIVILVLVGILGFLGVNTVRTYLSGAASGSEPSSVLAIPGDDGKTTTITWVSDKPTMGVVEYGTTPASLLLRNIETESVTNHSVVLSSLRPNVNYYFRIKVGENVFDNNGIPYSFKTKDVAVEEVGGQPIPVISPEAGVTVIPIVSPVQTGGGCSRTVDYNNDGVINSLDYVDCLNKSGGSATPTAASVSSGPCLGNVDYDNNGVVNSLDRIKCLQNSQQ